MGKSRLLIRIVSGLKKRLDDAKGRWIEDLPHVLCTDYFTKWVEAEPLANIRDVDIKRSIWKNIVTRFGVPNILILNNGLQFNSKAFRKYCSDLGIKNRYSTPAYP